MAGFLTLPKESSMGKFMTPRVAAEEFYVV